MRIREINKVVNAISRNLDIPECDIVIEPIENILVFAIPNEDINYGDICYSVSKRVIDASIYEKIMKEVDHRALFVSHSAVDNVGLKLEPLYDDDDIVKIAGEILIKISGIESGYSNMKSILESVEDLIKLLDKEPSFNTYSLKALKDLRLLAQNKLINNSDILYDFNFESGEDISDKDRAAILEHHTLESIINTSLRKRIYRIITDSLDKDFIIFV